MIKPRSVAVVGISAEPGSAGGMVYGNLKAYGYRGDVHLVSRNSKSIDGLPCVPSIDELPPGIDAAVLALPAAAIVDSVAACGRKHIASAVVFASGFAEVGGHEEQQHLVAAARSGNVGVCGPNCIGFTNYVDGAALTFEPLMDAPDVERPGIAILTQSGAMQSTLRLSLHARDIAVPYSISTGNEADLAAEDYLSFLIEEPRVQVIVLFAEQFRHPRAFLELAAKARTLGKPIVLMHPGRSERAQESARSHTGAMTGNHAVMRTLVEREGVIMVQTLEELIDSADLLLRFPSPPVKGVGVVTNSGAFKGYALDFCDALGLDLPAIGDETTRALKQLLPSFATIENPIDTTAHTARDPSLFGKCGAALLSDPAIGSTVVAMVPGDPKRLAERGRAAMAGHRDPAKPYIVSVFGDDSPLPGEFAAIVHQGGGCFIKSPDRALRAVARVTNYARSIGAASERPSVRLPANIESMFAQHFTTAGRGTLAEYRSKQLIAAIGVPVPHGVLTKNLTQALEAARTIGYPVVIKGQSSELPHKTEAGAVIAGIVDAAALESAWRKLHDSVARARPDLELEGVLVEAMAPAGVEMVVGARRDPNWGPVLMVGLGGIWIEALKDVRLMAADLPEARIIEEIQRLRGAALLAGLRRAPACDVRALAHVVGLVGALMRERPEIEEVDINPLVATPDGVLALDALLVIDRDNP